MSDTILKKFGRYILLDRVAQGGMAEIFRARAAAPDGGGRILIIKRIQTNYRSNREFLEMFKAEIKITMGFNHPNIVQLYDYGDCDGTPYIAMEYVDGKTVRQFAGRFFKKKELLPIDLVLSVVEQAARGLAYAHGYRDKMTGDELNIVHRDISPQNIIISYDGVIKLIDFGIAKARTSANLTRTGIIKGKPSYMAPEQVHGEELDGRSDVFALGIVLWELLTGKKLFSTSGKSEYTVLKMIESCDKIVKPPSVLNRNIKPELDEIALRALQKDREKRFPSATEFQRALQKHLVVNFPDHNLSEIPYWMDRLFTEDKAADQKVLRELNRRAEEIAGSEIPDLVEGEVNSSVVDVDASEVPTNVSEVFTPESEPSQNRGTLERVLEKDIRHGDVKEKKQGEKKRKKSGIPEKGHRTGEMRELELDNLVSVPITHGRLSRVVRKQTMAATKFPSRRPARGKTVAILAAAAALTAIVFFPDVVSQVPVVGDGFSSLRQGLADIQSGKRYLPLISELVRKRDPQDRAVSGGKPGATPAPEATPLPKSVLMTLRVTPAGLGTKITLNGDTIVSPAPVIELPFDTKIDMQVERPGFKSFKKEFMFMPSMFKQSREYQYEVVLEPEVFGYLSVRGNLSAEVYVREIDPVTKSVTQRASVWYFKSRFGEQKFPPGTYLVQLTNRALEMEAIETVRVQKGLISRVTAELESTPASSLEQVAPDKVLGLLGWFRAASVTGVREHDVIEAWNDSSKNLNQFYQRDPVQRPGFLGSAVNGQATMSFDGKNDGLDSETLAGRLRGVKTLTVVYVARLRAEGRTQMLIGCYSTNRGKTIFEAGFDAMSRVAVREGEAGFASPDRALASVSGGSGQFGIYSVVITGSSLIVHENGTRKLNAQGPEVDFSSTGVCTLGHGYVNGEPRDYFTGDVAEVLVYDHALSVREQDSIERYLAQLYRITGSKAR